jgi:glycogen operon protein
MLLMGDEVRRTQGGNNNAYSQDNEISWFDWNLLTKHADIYRFVKLLIKARLRRDISAGASGLTLHQLLKQARIQWHGVKLNEPDWSDESHSIALTAWSLRGKFVIHVMMNAYREPLEFELPPAPQQFGQRWYLWIDTSRESPGDICALDKAPLIRESFYLVQPHSIVTVRAVMPMKKSAC